MPRDWVDLSLKGQKMDGVLAPRGGYDVDEEGCAFWISYRESYGDKGKLLSSALHELGHRMEHVVPGIVDPERAFYEFRTRDQSIEYLSAKEKEPVKQGRFPMRYMGRIPYPSGRCEVLTSGLEAIFGRKRHILNHPVDKGETAAFVLGR